jgi:RimJ/RimL family protein N-acetyltransferase
MKSSNLQPLLTGNLIKLFPLKQTDFTNLYAVASDPLIWEQHPQKNRHQLEVFTKFFDEAIISAGAFIIYDMNNNVVGSSRYYNYNELEKSIAIGYTFIARNYWGGTVNKELKSLMINHAFTFVDLIVFHIGVNNFRSWKAIEKIGAVRSAIEIKEDPQFSNFIYHLTEADWNKRTVEEFNKPSHS